MDPVPDDAALRMVVAATELALRDRAAVLATAESCTGGWIGKACTDIAGSSDWFAAALVTYSNAAKRALLGVTSATLNQHGAVSEACAREMVAGALAQVAGADIAVAVTGIAGPGGGTAEKPAGTVWIAWQQRGHAAHAHVFRFAGDRDAVRRQTVAAALDGVRQSLTA